MALFEKIHIAFPKPQEGLWVIPSMLPEKNQSEPPRGSAKAIAYYVRKYELKVG